jgi:hypothetical protein
LLKSIKFSDWRTLQFIVVVIQRKVIVIFVIGYKRLFIYHLKFKVTPTNLVFSYTAQGLFPMLRLCPDVRVPHFTTLPLRAAQQGDAIGIIGIISIEVGSPHGPQLVQCTTLRNSGL